MGRLQGKRTLITGAASGIGFETARRFVEEGAEVCLTDLDRLASEQAAERLGSGALGIGADVTSFESMTEAVSAAAETFGGLDAIVCNAGVDVAGTVADTAEEDWDLIHDVVLKGTFLSAKAAWPELEAAGGGSILATASISATFATPEDAAYCAAKAGVFMLMKSIAIDGASSGIRANCVCPGYTDTPMLSEWFDKSEDAAGASRAIVDSQPLRRLGRPEDQANAFVYLASDEAEWLTGTAITVDGGLTAGLVTPSTASDVTEAAEP